MSIVARLDQAALPRSGSSPVDRASERRRRGGELHRACATPSRRAERMSMAGAGPSSFTDVQSLQDIAVEAADAVRHRPCAHVVHRCGEIAAGETIVFAGASSLHRRAAFEAADYLMDRLKTEAVFWKREVGADGLELDRADRGRLCRPRALGLSHGGDRREPDFLSAAHRGPDGLGLARRGERQVGRLLVERLAPLAMSSRARRSSATRSRRSVPRCARGRMTTGWT